jgi:putative ABC transport system permease protein
MKFTWFRRQQREEELDAEIRSHLDEAIRDRIARGETPDEARVNALREFGNVGLVKEVTRAMWGGASLERLMQDLRFGLRMLRKQPGFALIAVLTLGLGIGANTALFSIINPTLLRPLPYPESERLVTLQASPWVALEGFLEWAKQARTFAEFGAFVGSRFNLIEGDQPELVTGVYASARYLPTLGVKPLLGRAFLPEEHEAGRDRVVLISHGLWQRRFGSDPSVLGRTLALQPTSGAKPPRGGQYTIVGVLPDDAQFFTNAESLRRHKDTQVWLPLVLAAPNFSSDDLGIHWVAPVARLKPGVRLAAAQAEAEAVVARLKAQYPERFNQGWKLRLALLSEEVVKHYQSALLVLLGAVGFVLLIACVNVTNLLLARRVARQKETAIRAALGASRARLIRQFLAESLLLAVAGGAFGLLLALWGLHLFKAFIPANIPRVAQIGIDPAVLGVTLALSLSASLLFGLAPALLASRPDVHEMLKEGGRGAEAPKGSQRLLNLLVIAEFSLALVLMIGATLLIRSFLALTQVKPGFAPEQILTLRLELPPTKFPTSEQAASFQQRILERLRAAPGVEAAATVYPLPLGGETAGRGLEIEGRPEASAGADWSVVSSDYFRTMGISLVRGRYFSEHDFGGSAGAIIIDETMARRYWPTEDPLGKRIRVRPPPETPWLEIVGVVGDVKRRTLDAAPRPGIYAHYRQTPAGSTVIIRATAEPAALMAAVRGAIREVDREQSVAEIRPMTEVLSQSIAAWRFPMILLGIFAGLALAAVGIYGVMAMAVAERTRELAIRISLGAQRSDVLRLVLGRGLRLALAGVALGLAGAFALTRVIAALLYGVSATDPLTFGLIAALLVVVALLACWIPARRATKVDPMIALRTE